MSDAELLSQWRTGDRDAGRMLFERYYETIERFFVNKVSEDNIRDLVQETFLACVKSREHLRDPDKFRSYLLTTAFNVLRGHYRKKKRRPSEVDFDNNSMRNLASGPISLLIEKREQRLLLEALRHIPTNDQALLELHYWEQLTTSEMSEMLDIPHGTTKRRLQRARARLRGKLEELAESAEVLESTLSDLDMWAKQCRHAIGRAPAPES